MKIKKTKAGIRYVEFGPKEGKPLVYVHGWTSELEFERERLKDMFEFLAEKGYRVIVLELPGHGKSIDPGIKTPKDVVKLYREVLDELGVGSYAIFGFSEGAKIAGIMRKYDEKCKLSIGISPPLENPVAKAAYAFLGSVLGFVSGARDRKSLEYAKHAPAVIARDSGKFDYVLLGRYDPAVPHIGAPRGEKGTYVVKRAVHNAVDIAPKGLGYFVYKLLRKEGYR